MKKIFSSKKRVAAIGAVTAATLLGGGMAVAYWTTTGSGSGFAATTAGIEDQLSFTQDPLTSMYPGDSSQTLKVTVKNTDAAESVYVANVGAFITTENDGCDGSNFSINGSSTGTEEFPTPLNWSAGQLAAGVEVASTNTVQFNNKAGTNQDACKSAAVTINYVAS